MSKQIVKQKEKEVYDEKERRRREREKEREEKKKIGRKIKSVVKERKLEYISQEEVNIPVMEVDKTEIETKEVEIEKKISQITKKEEKITVPIVELEKPKIELKKIDLDYSLPKIIPEERRLAVPLIRLKKPEKVTCFITTFDERPSRVRVIKRMLKILIYRPSKPVIREIISSFDSRLDAQILKNLIVEKKKEEVSEESSEAISPVGEPSGGKGEFEDVPDIVDFVFGVPNTKISSRRPKIILYKELKDDSTIGSFETILIRIYREKEGGEPKFKPIEKLDDFNKKEIEKWLDTERKLISVDLDKVLNEECKNKNLDNAKKAIMSWFTRENLGEALRKTKTGTLGFLIFKTREGSLYEQCAKVLQDLSQEYRDLEVLYVEPKKLDDTTKKDLMSLIWGNLKFEERELSGIIYFDDLFNFFKREFEERLESLEKENNGIYIYATNQHEGEESSEHFLMKCFIVKLLSKERKLKDITKIKEMIKTEEEYEGVIPDIRVGHSVYEVETLFAEDRGGKLPKKKIEKTITKYEATDIKEINIVLDNLNFLRHLNDLIEIKKVLESWARNQGKVIRFHMIDIQSNKLLSLEDVVKKLKSLYVAI